MFLILSETRTFRYFCNWVWSRSWRVCPSTQRRRTQEKRDCTRCYTSWFGYCKCKTTGTVASINIHGVMGSVEEHGLLLTSYNCGPGLSLSSGWSYRWSLLIVFSPRGGSRISNRGWLLQGTSVLRKPIKDGKMVKIVSSLKSKEKNFRAWSKLSEILFLLCKKGGGLVTPLTTSGSARVPLPNFFFTELSGFPSSVKIILLLSVVCCVLFANDRNCLLGWTGHHVYDGTADETKEDWNYWYVKKERLQLHLLYIL